MRPLEDEDLILHYYDESDRAEEIERQLAISDELARRYRELVRVLDVVEPTASPPRSDLYGHEVWKRVYPRLEPRRRRRLPKAAGWAIAATLLLTISFWVGRQTAPPGTSGLALSEGARDRILLASIAEHLERSQFLLLELTNEPESRLVGGGGDLARELKTESRLYRQAARASGEIEVARVLEELERFLTEIDHLDPGSEDLTSLLQRLEEQNLLFKVRILGTRLAGRARGEIGPTT